MNLSIRNVSKQSIVSIGLLLALLCVASVFAVLYVERSHTYTYSIGIYGEIRTYITNTTTETTQLNFGTLDNTTLESIQHFDLKNTGNKPVQVDININASGWSFNKTIGKATDSHVELEFYVDSILWNGTAIQLAAGETKHIDLHLTLVDISTSSGDYTIQYVNFAASSVP